MINSKEGYLSKKSPSLFKGFQKRFFALRDQGTLLVYYKAKPSSTDKPKGIITIACIKEIVQVPSSECEFIIEVPDRSFHLKAESKKDKHSWIEVLQQLRTRKEITQDRKVTRFGDLDQQTMTRIKLEDEKANVLESIAATNQILECKGIKPYLNKFHDIILEKYVASGFMMKKGKISKLTPVKRRWFFLISSVAFDGQEQQDRPLQKDLPDSIKLDTLYYYKYDQKGDNSAYLGYVPCSEMIDIQLMDMNKNQFLESLKLHRKPYGFSFKAQDRQYLLFSEVLSQVTNWIKILSLPRILLSVSAQKPIEYIHQGTLMKKRQLLKGPLSWKAVECSLTKDSFSWNDQGDEEHILLVNIAKVIGKVRSFEIILKHQQTYKFRGNTEEEQLKWVGLIQQTCKTIEIKYNTKVSEVKSEIITQQDQYQEIPEPETDPIDSLYKKMSMQLNESKVDTKQPSFFQRLFHCCGGEEENERGF